MALFGRKSTAGKAPDVVIDVRPPPPPASPEFGRPTPCPACGHSGYLDGIDIKRRVMFQHCPACSTKWDTAESELTAAP